MKTIEKNDATRKLHELKKQDGDHANLLRKTYNRTDQVHKVTILNLPNDNVDPEHGTCHKDKGLMQNQAALSGVDYDKGMGEISSVESRVSILPWINGDGTVNQIVFKGLNRRVLGIVMQNPGMLEVIVSSFFNVFGQSIMIIHNEAANDSFCILNMVV